MSKTPRQIKVRDDLWRRVETLANRRGIGTDDVIQAALVQLFSKKKGSEPPAKPAPAAAAPVSPRQPTPPPAPRPARGAPQRAPTGGGLPKPGGGLPRPAAAAPVAPRRPAGPRPLYLQYEGQWYSIDQDQFVIGRGSKYSDLAIKDANISRRHAAVVRRNGEYFIKDLESTNGVEFDGERVDDHLIQEGAVYRMCDHEVRFSFIPPN